MNKRTGTIVPLLALVAALAACGGSETTASQPVSVTPAPDVTPSKIEAVGDTTFTGVVGATLAASPGVIVHNKAGAPLAGIAVTFSVTAGGGSVGASAVTTSADGSARTTWTLGKTPGSQAISATVTGLALITFRASSSSGAATALAKVQGDAQTATVGASATSLVVKATDAFGNPVAGVVLSATVKSGGGTIGGTTATTDGAGLATFNTWTIGTKPGANTLEISAPGLGAITFAATAVAGPAATIAFASSDTLFIARGGDSTVQIRVADQFGNALNAASAQLQAASASVATISGSSAVHGVDIGVTNITASLATLTATRPIVVVGHPTGASVARRWASPNGYLGIATANGLIVATTGAPRGVVRMDTTGRLLSQIIPDPTAFTSLAITPDASQAVIAGFSGGLTLVNLLDGTSVTNPGPTFGRLHMANDGKRVYAATTGLLAEYLLPFSQAQRGIHPGDDPVYDIATSVNDSLAYTIAGYFFPALTEIDTRTFSTRRSWTIPRADFIAVTTSYGHAFIGHSGAGFDVVRLSDRTTIRSVALPFQSFGMLASPDGRELYVLLQDRIQVYSIADPESPVADRSISISGPPWGWAMDPHGAFIVIAEVTNPGLIEVIR